jgi:acyl carrier protein
MPSAADDIVEMITARTSHTGGTLDLSESLDNLGLDSMEVVSLIFDIEEKFNIQIPINANMDIESKTLIDEASFWLMPLRFNSILLYRPQVDRPLE